MNFTFGIVTNGDDYKRLGDMLSSIHSQNIDQYEIIVIGGDPNKIAEVDISADRSFYIPFPEQICPSGWITKKKNIITARAVYENVVYSHDYLEFQKDWYKNFVEFGNDWDVCMNAIQNIHGQRFRDWVTWDDPILGRGIELPYDDDSRIKNQYISGTYWVAKRRFMLFNPLDENYNRATEYEDVEWSLRIRDKAKIKMNKHSVVKHSKVSREQHCTDRGYMGSIL